MAMTSNTMLEGVRAGILLFFLILEEKLSVLGVEYNVSCGLVICGLYYVLLTHFYHCFHHFHGWVFS